MPLKPYACANCGFWQRYFAPPPDCPVCTDVRNDLPEDGWSFVTPDEAGRRVECTWREVMDGVWEFGTTPRFGLDGKGWLIRHPEGNVAFEAAGFYSDAALDKIAELGGISVLSASHPHGYGALWQLQDRFAPTVMLHRDALPYSKAFRVAWPFDDDGLTIRPGLTLHPIGGHYEGHTALYDASRKALFSGDALKIDCDAAGQPHLISCHKAFHKRIPLSHGEVRRYREVMAALDFAHVFTPFGHYPGVTAADALMLFDKQLSGPPFFDPIPLKR
jgi:glyoxylase-like metal-dependent hydrolase (beta-lactamase superfamily II)